MWSFPWQSICEHCLAESWEIRITSSYFCGNREGNDQFKEIGVTGGIQTTEESVSDRNSCVFSFFFFPSQLLENMSSTWAVPACDSALSSRRAIACTYTHHDTRPVSKVFGGVTETAEYEQRRAVCVSETRADQCATCAPWKHGWGFSALLLSACVSVCSDILIGRLLPERKMLLKGKTEECNNYICVCVPACMQICVYAGIRWAAGLQEGPRGTALLPPSGFAQSRDGDVRAEPHSWRRRYEGCPLHQNNLSGHDGFSLIFQVSSLIVITSDSCGLEAY